MPRTLHDEFARDYLQEFLSDFGTVTTEYVISSEVRRVDVYFEPDRTALPAPMGLLGRMIEMPCLIEPFRNAVPVVEIGNCKAKSVGLGIRLIREAKSDGKIFHYGSRPFLWLISPTISQDIYRGFSGIETPEWGPGVFILPEHERTGLIAIHRLPVTLDSLWLRLLGRDNVQKKAVRELMALPQNHPYRASTLRHIAVLQKNLKARQNITNDLQEVIMALSITYEQIEAEILERGEARGRKEGSQERARSIALEMLREGIDPTMVARITQLPIDQLPTP
jgi:hypothetical protein